MSKHGSGRACNARLLDANTARACERDRRGASTRRSEKGALPQYKLITTGNGRVYPVDENGSLVKYTDNSAIVAAQGFQRIKERFKLLNSARKILKGERTPTLFL